MLLPHPTFCILLESIWKLVKVFENTIWSCLLVGGFVNSSFWLLFYRLKQYYFADVAVASSSSSTTWSSKHTVCKFSQKLLQYFPYFTLYYFIKFSCSSVRLKSSIACFFHSFFSCSRNSSFICTAQSYFLPFLANKIQWFHYCVCLVIFSDKIRVAMDVSAACLGWILCAFSFHKFNYNYFSQGIPDSKMRERKKSDNKLLSVSSQFKPHGT